MSSPLVAGPPTVITEYGLSIVQLNKKTIVLHKPIYVGACILESSKLIMFKLHYDVLFTTFPDSMMLKTDTDSLLYQIFTKDL